MVTIDTDCAHCGATFTQPDDPGRKRRFCSGACRTAAYRARKRRQQQQERQQQDQTRRQHERERRNRQERERQRQDRQANDDAWWNARERYQHRQPPPHAGTSRPGTWCGPCGGVRGPHTYHHDDTPRTSAPAAATRACAPRPPAPASRTRRTPAAPRQTPCATSTASNPRTRPSGTDQTSQRAAGPAGRSSTDL
jgi:hypothetical protein